MTTEKPIRFRCPDCSVQMRATAAEAGKQRRCPKCQTRFRIPGGPSKKSKNRKPKQEQLVPVVCGVCSTRIYAKLAEVGTTVECPDCFTQNMVKPLPKEKVVTAPAMSPADAYDLAPAEQIVVPKAMSEDLLNEADEVVKKEIESAPKMPSKPFWNGIFSYPFRLQILPIVLSMAMMWTLWMLFTSFAWSLEGFAAAVAPVLLAAAGIIKFMILMPSLVTFQKIMENSANGDDESSVRPEGGVFSMLEWFGDVIPILVAASISCVPTIGLVTLLKLAPAYQVVGYYAAFLLFPFVFLSMLENASIMGVVSGTVWASIGKIPGSWMKFWFIQTLLFPGIAGAAYWLWISALSDPTLPNIFLKAGVMSVAFGLATIYFRLLGRMAFVMTQRISTREEPSEQTETLATAS